MPTDPATTVIAFCVSVPVLSVQITDALAIVSQDPRTRTSKFSRVIRFVAKANASVTAKGRPGGNIHEWEIQKTLKTQTFRHSDHNQRDSDDENIHKSNAVLV